MTTLEGVDPINYPTLPQRLLAFLCCLVAIATAVLLWGVGAEAVCFSHSLSGALLLIDATVLTILESVTLCFFLLPRNSCIRFRRVERLSTSLDTYKRSILYALLTVTCFVRLDKYWLPALPGCAMILSSVMYMLKHCCNQKINVTFSIDNKMPSFVSFEGNASLTPDVMPSASPTMQPQPTQSFNNPIIVCSAVNDYWQDAASVPPAIQQPPALPPRRNRRQHQSGQIFCPRVATDHHQQQQQQQRCADTTPSPDEIRFDNSI